MDNEFVVITPPNLTNYEENDNHILGLTPDWTVREQVILEKGSL
jgi:hypothetical protein